MVDRLLRVHIQSQRAFGPWWTLSYNSTHIRSTRLASQRTLDYNKLNRITRIARTDSGVLPTGVHSFRLQGCMQVNISWFHTRLRSEPLSISMWSGSNGDLAEGRVFTMSRNVFLSIDATVIRLCPWFIIDPSDYPFPAPEISSPPGVSPDRGGAGALSCRCDGRSAARPRPCRWLPRLLLVVYLGHEAG